MKTLSIRTDRASASRPSSSDPEAGAPAEPAEPSQAPSALSRAGTLTRAGLSALGAGLLALARGACRFARLAAVRIGRWRIPERAGRAALAVAASSALLAVRIWLLCRVLFASRVPHGSPAAYRSRAPHGSRRPRTSRAPAAARPSRRHLAAVPGRPSAAGRSSARYGSRPLRAMATARPARRSRPPVRLTARGGLLIMFGACFTGLLLADWTNWAELADAVFFMASSLTAYYTRPGSLLPVAVSPPLLFFVAMTAEKFVVAPGTLAAFEGTLVMLASATTWLFTGTALTLAIALLRGLSREIRSLVLELRSSSHAG